jgi:hypothetical protein
MALHNVIHLPAKAVVVTLFDANQVVVVVKLNSDSAAALERCGFVFDDLHACFSFSVAKMLLPHRAHS